MSRSSSSARSPSTSSGVSRDSSRAGPEAAPVTTIFAPSGGARVGVPSSNAARRPSKSVDLQCQSTTPSA
ncbi:hypothetical protein ACFQFC_00335 [Amorphoplanes digitatis]|uniref:Uncharacterized protein n=1 Tax=Actinoplanes digitatis TaxID=1868 RepID=A0A7W7MPZ9_9ACTN|nr:hypothetical protein [Actinoplanes digitatis]